MEVHMAKARSRSAERKAPDYTVRGDIGGGPGASDSYSGGGNATGTPDAETGMRLGRAPGALANVRQDRAKLFPERFGGAKRSKSSSSKARTAKALKKHGDKFEDKIPVNTRVRSKRTTTTKRKSR
jgi:hypothetical protein